MKAPNSWFLLIISVLVISLAACSVPRRPVDRLSLSEHQFLHDGIKRTYLLISPGAGADEPLPLILALHGGGGTAQSMCAMPGGLAEPAQREGFLLVCPEGFERHWNDGRDIQAWEAHAQDIDDVGFLMALVDNLAERFPLDRGAIFATGISNGGQMSYRLACERAMAVKAIAPVAASMATTLVCEPSAPVSIMVINGTDDPLVPYEGGEIKALRRRLGTVHPTAQVIQFWAEQNACNLAAERIMMPDRDPKDDTRIWGVAYEHCASGSRVFLYEVTGGGHTWPGANQYLPEMLIGRLSNDMQASEAIIEFFSGIMGGSER